MWNRDSLSNISLGVLIGWWSAFAFTMLALGSPAAFFDKFGGAIVTASATIMASGVAIAGLLNARQRSLEAAKAVLPLALSKFHSASEVAIALYYRSCRAAHLACIPSAFSEADLAGTEIDSEVMSALQKCIEHAKGGDAARLANLIRRYQVARSRLVGRDLTLSNLEESDAGECINWCVLSRLIDDCYEYARGESAHIPAQLQMRSFTRLLPDWGLHLPESSILKTKIERAEMRDGLKVW